MIIHSNNITALWNRLCFVLNSSTVSMLANAKPIKKDDIVIEIHYIIFILFLLVIRKGSKKVTDIQIFFIIIF